MPNVNTDEPSTDKDDILYSLNEDSHSSFSKAVDEIYSRKDKSVDDVLIELGTTPEPLVKSGLKSLAMFMSKRKLVSIKNEHPEITPFLLKQIPKQLNYPVAVFKNTKKGQIKNSYVVLTQLMSSDGKNIIIALHAERKFNSIVFNKLASVYGRNNSVDYIKNMVRYADVRYVDAQKARSLTLQLQLLEEETLNELLDRASVVENNSEVKQNDDLNFSFAPLAGEKEEIRTALARLKSGKEYLHKTFADKFLPMKRVQEAIKEAGGKLDLDNDVYLAEERYHGIVSNDVDNIKRHFVEPLTKILSEANISQAELDEYLYNRHAQERNEYIASINPEMPDGGSGIKTKDAQAYLEKIERNPRYQSFLDASWHVYIFLLKVLF